jgi:hypothetical protein
MASRSGCSPKGARRLPSGSATAAFPNFPPKAKRVIYLFQSGAPSQMDLCDPKPEMAKRRGEDLPESIRQGQRLTTMTSGQKNFPVAPSMFKFAQHGESGMWFSRTIYSQGALTETNYGRDHLRLTYPYQGRDFRLTDVHGNVVKDIVS